MSSTRFATMSDIACATESPPALDALYRRINLRIITMLMIAYMLDCVDRLNIGFAQRQISERIGFSPADYGFAAGIFFIGYVLFEIPSNLLLPKIGARRTFARIMVLWGLTSACMGLIHERHMFYLMRFFLGVFEAGFAPAAMYYLTVWYPRDRMATALSLQQTAAPVAGVLAGPLSGFLVQGMDHVGGLDGWRWMFFLEGIPSVLMGFAVYFLLPENPSEAKWLTATEQRIVQDNAAVLGSTHKGFGAVLCDVRIYLLSFAYFCVICGIYTISFWLPTVLHQAATLNDLQVGLLSAIPYICATATLLIWGQKSDRAQERRWHSAGPAFLGAVGLVGVILFSSNLIMAVIALSLTAMAIYSAYLVFLAVPSDILKGPGAAGGYALINSIGLLGGFLSPMIIGQTTRMTGNVTCGLAVMAGIVAVGGVVLLRTVPRGKVAPIDPCTPDQFR